MKLLRAILGITLVLVLCMSTATFAADEIIIDVVNNELQVGDYRIELAEVEKPITIDLQNNEVILYIRSNVGEVELNLGEGAIALTQRSVAYIQLTPNAQGGPKPSATRNTSWDYCGVNNYDGHHTCPRCKLPYCIHDDKKCSYRMNPVPTPFSTTDPDGNTVTFYVAEDGSYYVGTPKDTYTKFPSIDSWKPGDEYSKIWATPSPTPTYLIVTPAPRR